MNKKFAVSYKIERFPEDHIKDEYLPLEPIVLLNNDVKSEIKIFKPPAPIKMYRKPLIIEDSFRDKNIFYTKTQRKYRENQERIISDLICGIILSELRTRQSDEKLIFFIASQFATDKVVGRLAYLNLPIDQVTILFISRSLVDLHTRNLVYPYDYRSDLDYLLENNKERKTYGPFPDDGSIGLLRTFYMTFGNEDFYPAKIDLFTQGLDRRIISEIKNDIENDYFLDENTQSERLLGLKAYTRLPIILCDCEEKIRIMLKEEAP